MDLHVVTIAQLSAHLRALRKARKLTQADLGRLLGVKQSRIADIESDPGAVSVTQMHRLLSALGVQLMLRDSGGGWQPVRQDLSAAGMAPSTHKANRPVPAMASSKATRVGASAKPPLLADKKPAGSW